MSCIYYNIFIDDEISIQPEFSLYVPHSDHYSTMSCIYYNIFIDDEISIQPEFSL